MKTTLILMTFVSSFSSFAWSASPPRCPGALKTALICKGDSSDADVAHSIYLVCQSASSEYSVLGGTDDQSVPADGETLPATKSSAEGVDKYAANQEGLSITLIYSSKSPTALNADLEISFPGPGPGGEGKFPTKKFGCK